MPLLLLAASAARLLGDARQPDDPELIQRLERVNRVMAPLYAVFRQPDRQMARERLYAAAKEHAGDWVVSDRIWRLVALLEASDRRFEDAHKAIREMERLRAEHPEETAWQHDDVALVRARVLDEEGRYSEAREAIAPLLELQPTHPAYLVAVLRTAYSYAEEKDLPSALRLLETHLAKVGDADEQVGARIMLGMGEVRLACGDKEGALSALDEMVRRYPKSETMAAQLRKGWAKAGAPSGCTCGCGAKCSCCEGEGATAKEEQPQE